MIPISFSFLPVSLCGDFWDERSINRSKNYPDASKSICFACCDLSVFFLFLPFFDYLKSTPWIPLKWWVNSQTPSSRFAISTGSYCNQNEVGFLTVHILLSAFEGKRDGVPQPVHKGVVESWWRSVGWGASVLWSCRQMSRLVDTCGGHTLLLGWQLVQNNLQQIIHPYYSSTFMAKERF